MSAQAAVATGHTLTSVAIRERLVETLRLDLVGPNNDHEFAQELLPEPPTRWYQTGYLVPTGTPLEQKLDETSTEEIDSASDVGATDDGNEPDRGPARRSLLPSSMGLSVLVPAGVRQLKVLVEWGDYQYEGPGEELSSEAAEEPAKGEEERDGPGGPSSQRRCWRREPRQETVLLDLPEPGSRPKTIHVPGSGGLQLLATVRLAGGQTLPAGTKAVSVFLVNYREATKPLEPAYRSFVFQARLSLFSAESFVPRPDPRAWDDKHDWD